MGGTKKLLNHLKGTSVEYFDSEVTGVLDNVYLRKFFLEFQPFDIISTEKIITAFSGDNRKGF